jgi:hypothetical protein
VRQALGFGPGASYRTRCASVRRPPTSSTAPIPAQPKRGCRRPMIRPSQRRTQEDRSRIAPLRQCVRRRLECRTRHCDRRSEDIDDRFTDDRRRRGIEHTAGWRSAARRSATEWARARSAPQVAELSLRGRQHERPEDRPRQRSSDQFVVRVAVTRMDRGASPSGRAAGSYGVRP